MKKIYLDYAAATPLDPRVARVMARIQKITGNPSSLHWAGQETKKIIDDARVKIGRVLHCRPEELVFTGSGTEADNLAIFGVAKAYIKKGKHLITTNIEHHAILRACEQLEQWSWIVTYLPVDKNGLIKPEQVAAALRPDTVLVSIGYANNEIGTIQPIKQIKKAIRTTSNQQPAIKVFFHTDASAAAGYLPLNVQDLGVDLMTINGAKIYGPEGVGCLFVRRGVQLTPLLFGGDQERGRRAGTESPTLIAGLAEALAVAEKNRAKASVRLAKLRDWLIGESLKLPGTRLNGDAKSRLPNNVNTSFQRVDGEMLTLALDRAGIAVSTGAACTTRETGQSHVLRAIKNPSDWGNLRITIGRQTTQKDLEFFIKMLAGKIKNVRSVLGQRLDVWSF